MEWAVPFQNTQLVGEPRKKTLHFNVSKFLETGIPAKPEKKIVVGLHDLKPITKKINLGKLFLGVGASYLQGQWGREK